MKTQPVDTPAAPAAVVDPEPIAKPQTAAEIAESEQALGIAPRVAVPPTAAKVPVLLGIAPKTLEEGWRLAQLFAQSDLVPKGYRGRPADILVAIQYGMEVGLPPMSALHSIYITNGRPNLWGDGFLAVIMASPPYHDHDEYYMVGGERRDLLVAADLTKDDTMAVCTFWRKDKPNRPRTASFSIAQAKKARLWTKEGPWQEYPDRMLKFRARDDAGHDAFPDVLRGVATGAGVVAPPIDFTDVTPEPPKEVRRKSETAPAAVAVVDMPPADEVTIGPVKVLGVEQFLGGYTASLHNGQKVDVLEELEAMELEKFVGTPNAVRLLCTKGPENSLVLKSFAIAD